MTAEPTPNPESADREPPPPEPALFLSDAQLEALARILGPAIDTVARRLGDQADRPK